MATNETVEVYADKAWRDYYPPLEIREQLDALTDDQYFLVGDMFAEGFKAGVVFLITNGQIEEKKDGNTL